MIRINPDHAYAHKNLGLTYYNLKQYDEAIASYKEAIRIRPGFFDAYFNLALNFDETEDGENAKFYMKRAGKLYKIYGNEKMAGYASSKLKDYFAKYGDDPILPVDYSESDITDINSREIWFEFESAPYKLLHLSNFRGEPVPIQILNCSNLLDDPAKFIVMRSGRFLYQVNVNGISHEFLGLKVNPKNALVDYSGVNGFSFSERLTFELKQHVRNIIIKFSGEAKKVKRCEIQLAGILKKELNERQEYEQARASIIDSTRQPGNIAPPIIPSKPRTPPPPVFQPPVAQAPTPQPQQPPKAVKRLYSGTGFMFGSKDYVITNWHVIRGSKNIKVKFLNGEKVNAELLLKDAQNDIAFLKLERSPELPPSDLKIGDSSKVRLGDKVFTIGYPAHWVMGEKPKYTSGDVNALSGIKDDPTVFQISVQIQPGNSGGPLFNQSGEVIGITQSSLDPKVAVGAFGTLPQNVNYAIKSSYISNLLPMLPETLIASRGITVVPTEPENSLGNFIDKAKNNIVLIKATSK